VLPSLRASTRTHRVTISIERRRCAFAHCAIQVPMVRALQKARIMMNADGSQLEVV
jgi:hypothetical protein